MVALGSVWCTHLALETTIRGTLLLVLLVVFNVGICRLLFLFIYLTSVVTFSSAFCFKYIEM